MLKRSWSSVVLSVGLLLAGCSTTPVVQKWIPTDDRGRVVGTGFEAVDLVIACGEMGEVINAFGNTSDVAWIEVEPVSNETRLDLPLETFDEAVFGQLRVNAPKTCRLIRTGDSAEPNLYLMGKLQRLIPKEPRGHEVLLYSYQMVDARNNEVFWESSREIIMHTPPAGGEAGTRVETSAET